MVKRFKTVINEISAKKAENYLLAATLSATEHTRKSGAASANRDWAKSAYHEKKAEHRVVGQVRALKRIKKK
jgi:hypothetical protein